MRSLSNLLDVQRQELPRLLPLISAYGLVMASLYVLKPARNALFLDRLGVGQLPVVLVLVALIGGLAALVFSRFSTRVRLDRLVFFTFLLLGACLLGFRLLLPTGWGWTYYLFYVWVNLYGLMATSLLWLLANALFNAREGRRLFGLIGTSGIVGAILGGVGTGELVEYTGTENLLLVCAGLVGVCLLLLYPVRVRDAAESGGETSSEEALGPLQTVRASKLLSLLAGMAGLAAAVAAVIDVQFNQIVDAAMPDKDAKTAFFGQFFAGLSAFALLFQLFVAPRVLRSMGVTSALLFLPLSMALGSLAVLFIPGLAAGILLKVGDGGFRHSIHKSATEILYLPVPAEAKKRTKVLLDTTVDNLATGIGAVAVLGALAVGLEYRHLSYVSLGLVALWLGLIMSSRRAYVDSFRQALERSEIDLTEYTVDISEAGTLDSVVSVLQEHAGNERHVLYALEMISVVRAQRLVEPVSALLQHDSAEVRERALQVLHLQTGDLPLSRFEELLEDDALGVRVEALQALCVHRPDGARQLLEEALRSPSRNLRSAAVGCIAEYGIEEEQALIEADTVRSLLIGADEEGMVQAARLLGRIYDPSRAWVMEMVDELARSPHPRVVRQLVESLGEAGDETHLPWLVDRLTDSRTRRAATEALANFGAPAARLLVQRVLQEDRPPRQRVLAARALAGIATQDCVLAVFDCFDVAPTWLEYPLMKSLSKLRTRHGQLVFPEDRVQPLLRAAAESHGQMQRALRALPGEGERSLQFLLRAIGEKRDQHLKRVFRLLGLVHSPQDLYNAYLGFVSGDRSDRASAIEFLENLLHREARDLVVPLLDAHASDQPAMAPSQAEQVLHDMLHGQDAWLRACVAHYLAHDGPAALREQLSDLRDDGNPLVREVVAAAG